MKKNKEIVLWGSADPTKWQRLRQWLWIEKIWNIWLGKKQKDRYIIGFDPAWPNKKLVKGRVKNNVFIIEDEGSTEAFRKFWEGLKDRLENEKAN